MVMCKRGHDKAYGSLEEQIAAHFHPPGKAKEYLERVSCASRNAWVYFTSSIGCRTLQPRSKAPRRVGVLQIGWVSMVGIHVEQA